MDSAVGQAKLKASQDKQQLAMEPLKRAFLEQMARSRALLPASDSAPQLGRPPSRAPSNATAEELEDHNISAIVSAALDSAMSSQDPPLVVAPPSRMDSDPDFEDALAAHALPPSQIEAKDNEVHARPSSGSSVQGSATAVDPPGRGAQQSFRSNAPVAPSADASHFMFDVAEPTAASVPFSPTAETSTAGAAPPDIHAPTLVAHPAPAKGPFCGILPSSPSSLILPAPLATSASQPATAIDPAVEARRAVIRQRVRNRNTVDFAVRGSGESMVSRAASPPRSQPVNWSESMKQRLSMGASSFPAAPPAHATRQVVIVCRDKDQFTVEISADSDHLAYAGLHKFLVDNQKLRLAGESAREKADAKDFTIGEFELLRLHNLIRLRELQLENACAYNIHVSFISQQHFLNHDETMQNAGLQPSKVHTRGDKKDSTSQWTQLKFDHGEFPTLTLAAAAGKTKAGVRQIGNMFFRHCQSVHELTRGAAPIRALQCTHLMLASGLGATPPEQEMALQRFQLSLMSEQNQHHLPTCVPPSSWNETASRKHLVYPVFEEFMIRTRWVKVPLDAFNFLCNGKEIQEMIAIVRKQLQAFQAKKMSAYPPDHPDTPAACAALASIEQVVAELLEGQPDGKYYVKGTHGECANRVHPVEIVDGECPALEAIVVELTARWTQSHIALQRAIPQFERNEYRHWCIAVPVAEGVSRWINCFSLKSGQSLLDPELLDVSLSAPISPESVACQLLVEHLLSVREGRIHDFFQELLRQGMPAIRIDCGYDYDKERAFFNEFAIPTDGSYWPTVHNLDLPLHIAKKIGFLLFHALDESQQNSTHADQGAAAGSAASSSASTVAADELKAGASSASSAASSAASSNFAASSAASSAASPAASSAASFAASGGESEAKFTSWTSPMDE